MVESFSERASRLQQSDLEALVADALILRNHAVETGRASDSLLAQLSSAFAFLLEEPRSPEAEEAFLLAHRALCESVEPVTAASLRRSRNTRLPRLSWSDGRLPRIDARDFFVGRLITAAFFFILIFMAAVALSYEARGRALLAEADATRCEAMVLQRQIRRLTVPPVPPPALPLTASSLAASNCTEHSSALAAAQRELDDAGREVSQLQNALNPIQTRLADDTKNLEAWLGTFCKRLPDSVCGIEGIAPLQATRYFLGQLRDVFMPLLLGLLGACCSVMRSMSASIQARTFAPGSSLQHISRLSLGALAGILAGWIIAPESVKTSAIPVNALAFIAGFASDGIYQWVERVATTLFPTKDDPTRSLTLPTAMRILAETGKATEGIVNKGPIRAGAQGKEGSAKDSNKEANDEPNKGRATGQTKDQPGNEQLAKVPATTPTPADGRPRPFGEDVPLPGTV